MLLEITNEKNVKLVFTDSDDFQIELLDGFYSSSATIGTVKVGTTAGERLAYKTQNKRNLGVYIKIKQNVQQNRAKLYRLFQSGIALKIHYKNSIRDVIIDGHLEDITITPHDMTTSAQMVIVCPNPYFKNVKQMINDLNNVEENFTFPFAIEESGIPFSYYLTIAEENIYNGGDIDSGIVIELRASGTVTNPRIYNRDTLEMFGFGTTENPFEMEDGDLITIDTDSKKTTLKRNGINHNIFNDITPNVSWFKLSTGDNVFTYEATTGEDYLDIRFIHQDKYEGV